MASSLSVHAAISYGSLAYWLGRKADESATHRWTLFVRGNAVFQILGALHYLRTLYSSTSGPHGEDVSYFISKVVFRLHDSFATPVREVTTFPFEVTENGWGEFDAVIRIHFKDPQEEPIEFTHSLKLYPPGNMAPVVKRPVVSEVYDEVVFTNPSSDFFDILNRGCLKSVQNQVFNQDP